MGQNIIFDELSVTLSVGTLILGFFSSIIVGSQNREDARSVAIWSLLILIPMLLISCARLWMAGPLADLSGGTGMVVLFSGLVASIGIGDQIALWRFRASQIGGKGRKADSGLWNDEVV